MLDVNLHSVDKLVSRGLPAIVLFVKFKSTDQIRKVKDSRLGEKISAKIAKEMFEHAQKLQAEFSHVISGEFEALKETFLFFSSCSSYASSTRKRFLASRRPGCRQHLIHLHPSGQLRGPRAAESSLDTRLRTAGSSCGTSSAAMTCSFCGFFVRKSSAFQRNNVVEMLSIPLQILEGWGKAGVSSLISSLLYRRTACAHGYSALGFVIVGRW